MNTKVEDKTTAGFANKNVLVKDWPKAGENLAWQRLDESELDTGRLAITQTTFAEGWDINDKVENDYWDSL